MSYVYVVMKYIRPELSGVEFRLGRLMGVFKTHDLAVEHMHSCEKLFGTDMWTYGIEYTAVVDK